jgi:biotin carboxyl carrier protein
MVNRIEHNKSIIRSLELPYPGEVYVKIGDEVTPETLIAKTELLDVQPGYFEVANEIGLEPESSELKEAIKVEVGQYVDRDHILVKSSEKVIKAPYYGYVEHVSVSGGYLLIRQKVTENEEPLIIDAAKELGVSNRTLKNVLQVKVSDKVVRGNVIAGDSKSITTPMGGTVIDISVENGTITIKPHYKPTYKQAGIYGVVADIREDKVIDIKTEVDIIHGTFGIGRDATGVLNTDLENANDKSIIYVSGHLNYDMLKKAERDNVLALIADSVDAEDLYRFFLEIIAEGVTEQINGPFSVTILEKFGENETLENVKKLLFESVGKVITVSSGTNVQTPAKRPEIYIYI